MLSRKNESNKGKALDTSWLEKLCDLLQSTYGEKANNAEGKFKTFGFHYSDEVLLITSYQPVNHPTRQAISLFLSYDIDPSTKNKKLLDHLVDVTGLFFDQYFEDEAWNDYLDSWKLLEFKQEKYFFKTNREDIELTLKANELLASQ